VPSEDFTDPRLVAVYETCNPYRPGTQPDFYAALAVEVGARTAVELGCGTGLVARALARAGLDVVGVDPAPAMVEVARRRPDGDRVRWVVGDATALPGLTADLAVMAGHVAQFFLTDEAWHEALTALAAVLRPHGVLAFESRNPDAREWERWTRAARTAAHDPVAGRIDHWSEVTDVACGVVSYTNHYLFAATGEEVVTRNRLRFRTEEELRRSLAAAGLTVERVYGGWDRSAPRADATELVVVARAAP
jgi:SAM-dependent methyltransferase